MTYKINLIGLFVISFYLITELNYAYPNEDSLFSRIMRL